MSVAGAGGSDHRVTSVPVNSDLARRRSLLTAALGCALLDTREKPTPPEVQTVRTWLDNWRGVEYFVTGIKRQAGYILNLAKVDAAM